MASSSAPPSLALTLAPESRFLTHPLMQALGRWSYGIFLWHMAVLSLVFPLLGVHIFGGHLLLVTLATVVVTIPIAAASYALVEEPARRWFGRVWVNRPARPSPSPQSEPQVVA